MIATLRNLLSFCLIASLLMVSGAASSFAQSTSAPAPSTTTNPQTQQSTPLGTAAAPAIDVEGTPGSRPSGAAVSAGKQKRNRSFAVRTAVIVGAVVAVGIVAGLSAASPSHSH